MSNTLANQVALVTGGAQGLGQAICLRLANEGCDVAVADIKLEQAQATADLIVKETGRRGLAVMMDVTDEASVQAGFARTVQEFGRLDILVANAGILIAGEVTEFPAEKWRAVMNVNLFGYFLAAKEAARHHEGAAQRGHHPDQLQVGQEGQLQELGLRGQQVRRHRPDPEPRAGAGRARRARQRHLPRQPARLAAVERRPERALQAVCAQPGDHRGSRSARSTSTRCR